MGNIGTDTLAYQLNDEGWVFRNRKNQPRRINEEDVRRVIGSWQKYGGIISEDEGRAKDRAGYNQPNPDDIYIDAERAVFPVELLKTVGHILRKRALKPKNSGVRQDTRHYALGRMIYCWHCELQASQQKDQSLLTRFGAQFGRNDPRYRHKTGIKCGCRNRSVRTNIVEEDFHKLLNLLTVEDEYLETMKYYALQLQGNLKSDDKEDIEGKKKRAIAKARRKQENALQAWLEDEIGEKEYHARKESLEREISQWEARTTEPEKIMIELVACINAFNQLQDVWNKGSNKQKNELAQNIFTHIFYDLDARRIRGFILQPWLERFFVLRGALYEDEVLKRIHADKGVYTAMPHTGFEPVF